MRKSYCVFSFICFFIGATTVVFGSNGRIPIYQPTVITLPGSYYLTADIPLGSPSITIGASNITIDLQGHAVQGTIQTNAMVQNIRITNGRVTAGGNIDLSLGGSFFRVDNLQIDSGAVVIGPGDHMIVEHTSAQRIFYIQVRNGQIMHNTLSAPEVAVGIDVMESSNIEISYNNSYKNMGEGIHLGMSMNCIISYNDACENTNNGLIMESSHNNSIMHNNFSWNRMNGIYGMQCTNNVIVYNNCSSNNSLEMGLGNGIFLEFCSANDISNNVVGGNEVDGIHLVFSSSNKIMHNTCSTNTQIGINLISNSQSNNLDWNHATNNAVGFNFDGTTLANIYSHNRAMSNVMANYQDVGANWPVVYGAGFPTNF